MVSSRAEVGDVISRRGVRVLLRSRFGVGGGVFSEGGAVVLEGIFGVVGVNTEAFGDGVMGLVVCLILSGDLLRGEWAD